jgi:hypothetical protein
MFKKRYTLLLITTIGFSACTAIRPQTIIVSPNSRPQQPIKGPIKAPPIKEEILIKNNPNLGNRISVPKNRPTLGTKESVSSQNIPRNNTGIASSSTGSSELNGETMQRIAFPTDEYSRLKKRGRNTVSGKIYLQSSVNDQKITKNRIKLYLNPVTSYSRQWYQQSYLGGYKLSQADKRLTNYLRIEYTTDGGEFRFFGVPKGNYYLIGQISCAEKCGYSTNKHIRLVKEITVNSNASGIELMKIVP